MGRALARISSSDLRFELVAVVTGRNVSPIDGISCPLFAINQLGELPGFDVLIDFSQPEAFESILDLCKTRKTAMVSGTTGLTDSLRNLMVDSARDIPVLWASNFSLGVAVLNDLVRRAAKVLENWGVDITETHHVHKLDAPSGTALTLGQAVGAANGREPGIESIRQGEVIGEHVVRFSGMGETLELAHRADDRDIFARGALEAARRLAMQPAGQFSLAQLLSAES